MPKNPDYSESAINLVNPIQVAGQMERLRGLQADATAVRTEAEALIPPTLKQAIAKIEAEISVQLALITNTINASGSYQDITIGVYAIAQRKVSVTYDPVQARAVIPDFANAVINEAVDKKAIGGLLKGNLITPEQVARFSRESFTVSYIIKNVGPAAVKEEQGLALGDEGVVVTK